MFIYKFSTTYEESKDLFDDPFYDIFLKLGSLFSNFLSLLGFDKL